MKKKLMIIGLDGATWTVIDRLIKKGELKFFKRMKKKQVWGELKSIILPVTGTLWPSIFTGKNPGKHGIFDFSEVKDYRGTHYMCSKDIKAKLLWEYLEENGIKCGLINIPLSSPFRSKISFGEGDHLRKDWVNFSWPEDTTAGLDSRNPNFNKRLLDLIDLRFRQLDYVMKNKEFDFFAMNIYEHDPVLHYRWDDDEYIKKAMKKIDSHLDKFSKKLKGTNTTLIIMSDHGMVKLTRGFYIHNWLEKTGYLKLKKKIRQSMLTKIGLSVENYRKLINPFISFLVKHKLMRFIKKDFRNKYRRTVGSILSEKDQVNPDKLADAVNWKETKAYGTGSQGRVILNLEGREKEWAVKKEDYEKTREEIISSLKKFCEDEKIRLEVYKREDIYRGPYVENAPDFVFIMDEGAVRVNSSYLVPDKPGEVFSEIKKDNVLAEHHVTGIFMATSEEISRMGKGRKIEVSALDITPTVLSFFGLPVPEDMDGRILKEIAGGEVKEVQDKKETKQLVEIAEKNSEISANEKSAINDAISNIKI